MTAMGLPGLGELPPRLAPLVTRLSERGPHLCLEVAGDALPAVVEHMRREHQARLASLHATDERPSGQGFRLHAVLDIPGRPGVVSVSAPVDPSLATFPSITPVMPAANWYEREVQDLFGLLPVGHPDPRPLVLYDDWPAGEFPLRKDFERSRRPPRTPRPYEFRRVEGEGIMEIPVGPVHAGVIEPGHFRFSVAGEPIVSLEIRMGYVHKGIEKLSEAMPYPQGVMLAERISGDASAAHSVAYCQTVEGLAGAEAPERAQYIRTVVLEMERLYNHFGDLAGIALDTAYSVPAAHGYLLRERMLGLNECITGSRLLRSVNVLGGVRRDITADDRTKLLSSLVKLRLEFEDLVGLMLSSPSMLDRVETTGVLRREVAEALNVVGPAARASGIDRDVRRDRAYAAYAHLSFIVPTEQAGDVGSRMRVKIAETRESFSIIEQALDGMPGGPIREEMREIPSGEEALSFVEASRGELLHWVRSGQGSPDRHKVRDPSFCNWLAMEHAVLGDIVPDFPLINKSFNLSYSGNDL